MSQSLAIIQPTLVELSSLPDFRTSKMGYAFDANSDIWVLDGSKTLNLTRTKYLDRETGIGLRKTLCRYAEELSATTTAMMLSLITRYCKDTQECSVNVIGLTNWRASLTDETEHRLGALKSFLIAWNEWGYPGVDLDVVEYLEEQTLKGIVKGKAVKSMCPFSGPLTSIESGALLDWASNAFLANHFNLSQYSYFMTLVYTGRRSVQVRSLRACDLACREGADGHDYMLNVPRVKQSGVKFREAFKSVPVNEDLYLILKNQSEESQAKVEAAFGVKLSNDFRKQIPLFLEEERLSEFLSLEDLFVCTAKMPDFLHMTHRSSMDILRSVAVKNTAKSERTGEFINFTSRRFRYTTGTNLARRGITGVALALAMDHSSTQNIDVYTANTEEMAVQIDAVMASILAPLAQACAGVLIDSERDALRGNDPHSRMKNAKSHNVGSCGTYAFCASGYRSCYTCVNFQPWRDAPHQEVLDEILDERERQRESGVSVSVIQSTDRLLLAVQQVIFLCQQPKNGALNEVDNG
nr:site-specific integrase [uncultured Deefgea sp.]